MTVALTVLATLLAGAAGAVIRALVVSRLALHGTHLVNLAGTLLLALVVATHARGSIGASSAVILGVGLSGSLTTFSGWVGGVDAALRPPDGTGGTVLRMTTAVAVRHVIAPLAIAVAVVVVVLVLTSST